MKNDASRRMVEFTARTYALALMGLLMLPAAVACADVTLPQFISDHMVVQADMPVKIFGRADPGEHVAVDFAGHAASTQADADGRWGVSLSARKAGGPYEVIVRGKNTIRIEDVMVGEVWLCSGQSNMHWRLIKSDNAEAAIAAADLPKVRLLYVPRISLMEPAEDVEAKWEVCTPETVAQFSAIAYYFGRQINSELDVPVGLINAAFGGVRIIPWVTPQGIAEFDELGQIVTDLLAQRQQYRKQLARQIDAMDTWVDKTRAALAEGKPVPLSRWPRNPLGWHYAPSALYNAMVHPFTAMPVRGALWYQGESNVRHQQLYRQEMLGLIRGWRGAWDQPDMPFYYVQLAPFRFKTADTPYEIPKLREIQTSVLSEPNTGMVVTTDVGDIVDIHPRNKAAVGERLALWALAKTYGRPDIVYCGPVYKSLAVEGDKIRISFEHVGGGLVSTDHKPLSWFEIAGADGRYTPAKAKIDGATVLVHSPEVPQPVAVRFAWHEEAQPNLANAEGLPAGQFRTNSP